MKYTNELKGYTVTKTTTITKKMIQTTTMVRENEESVKKEIDTNGFYSSNSGVCNEPRSETILSVIEDIEIVENK